MVNDMDVEYQYTVADETEVDELLSGHEVSGGTLWNKWSKLSNPRLGSTGVAWQRGESPDEPARPLFLVAHEDDIRRLCGRYAQLRSDLSPITSWCHLLTPRFLQPLESTLRKPDLQGMQAAWTGLIVAEAVLLAERQVSGVRISACLATQSFAIARTNALWNHITVRDVLAQFDSASKLCRSETLLQRGEARISKLRASLEPLWDALIAISQGRNALRSSEISPIVEALEAFRRARSDKDKQEARHLARPLLDLVPEADEFDQLPDLAPEMRLRLFDKLVAGLDNPQNSRAKSRRIAVALLAGYLATVAAGGSPSISLAENHALKWPEILAWAFLIGGIGENVVWTSSFDGLGRLVARELMRPLRLEEPPTCDFSLDEANVLVDPKLSDPLVHLRIKQARLVTVALFPGVNIAVPIADLSPQPTAKNPEPAKQIRPPEIRSNDPLAVLADALWPHLRGRFEEIVRSAQQEEEEEDGSARGRGKRKSGTQSQLPLGSPKRY
jgi:hypothetical protein